MPGSASDVSRKDMLSVQRRILGAVALLLAVLLAILVVVLLRMLPNIGRPVVFPSSQGIESLLVIEGPGEGTNPLFARPMGVAVGPDGRIYVTDPPNNRVCVFSEEGAFLFEFGEFGIAKPLPGGARTWLPGRMNYPVGIDVDSDGAVYVADFRNDQIQVFDADGRFLRRFPDPYVPTGRGSAGQDGGGIAVTDVAVRDGRVFATDSYQVLVFSTEGKLLAQFGRPGRQPGQLDHPNGVAIGRSNVVYVSDSNNARVQAFSPEGTLVWVSGKPPTSMNDTTSAEFELPRGLAVTDDGTLLVSDAFEFALVAVEPDGRIAARYGMEGTEPGRFLFPNDVEAFGDRLIVADKENRRVQVVRLVGEAVP